MTLRNPQAPPQFNALKETFITSVIPPNESFSSKAQLAQ